MNNQEELVPILDKILIIRGKKVILDSDIAELYNVKTKVLNQAVKRNQDRFPNDFIFQLTSKEYQEVVTNCDHLKKLKYSTTPPHAFTENGVSMLSSVLKSKKAIKVNIQIMRTFTKLRQLAYSNGEFFEILDGLRSKYQKREDLLKNIYMAIDQLVEEEPENQIGFTVKQEVD